MAESKVKRENFITIQGFMIADLKLKGNELLIYACIYGFSQAENQVFNGSLQYLADWTNSTKQGVIKCLKSLLEKEYIVKNEKTINGVKFCEYYATELNTVLNKVEYPIEQSLTGGIKQSLHNNIISNTNCYKEERKRVAASFDSLIDTFVNTYIDGLEEREKVKSLLGDWLKVRKAKRAAMTDRSIALNLNKLDRLATASGLSVADYLEEVICKGWTAFYPIKDCNKPAPKQSAFSSSSKDEYMKHEYTEEQLNASFVNSDEFNKIYGE